MSDKTIKDRGITTTTLSAPWAFGFDKTTRQLELVYYYQYCVDNGLITVAGQQSRTNLIKKTFNHKGGTGIIWNLAMADWLKDEIPSAQNDLYKLWLAYFTKHATTPDDANVVYGGLSVEAAYRKFLTDHIGGAYQPFNQVFSDSFLVNDALKLIVKRIFSDSVTMQDAMTLILKAVKQFSDSYNLNDSLTVKQLRSFLDSYSLTDDFTARLAKAFSDSYSMQDSFTFTRGIVRLFSDSFTMQDAITKRTFIYRFSDSVSLTDALLIRYKAFFSDSYSLTDQLNKTSFILRTLEDLYLMEDTLAKITRIYRFSDSFTMQDSFLTSGGGYNADGYGQNGYNQ